MDNRADTPGIKYNIWRDMDWPKYCTKCGKPLHEKSMHEGFDAYTGKAIVEPYLICRTLLYDHDKYHILGEEAPF